MRRQSALTPKQRREDLKRRFQRAPAGLSVTQITDLYHIDRTTAYRDIKELRNEGMDLVRAGRGRQWRNDFQQMLVRMAFTGHEVVALTLASRLLAHQSDEQNPHVVSALHKLGDALQAWSPVASDLIHQAAGGVAARRASPGFVARFEAISRAWLEQRKVRLIYHSYHAPEPSERIIHPYFLEPSYSEACIYLVGFDESRNAERTFKLERVLDAQMMDETFTIPKDANPGDRLGSSWGIMWGTKGETITLQFDATSARRVKETIWHPSQQIEDLPDGGCRFTIVGVHPLEFIPWIQRWGADVEVLEPQHLRVHFAAEAKRLAARYQ